MTKRIDDPTTPDEGEDSLGELLRFAGRRDPVPADRAARVKGRVRAQWQTSIRRQRWQRRGWGALAGLGVAATLVVAVLSWQRYRTDTPIVALLERTEGAVWFTRTLGEGTSTIRAQTGIETGAGGRAALRLNGGASLRIDILSRARLISESEIFLERGAVYLDTGGSKKGPALLVRTEFGAARDIGTQFELRVTGPGVRLRVREGLVNLDSGGPVHTAHPGDELRLAPGGAVVRAAVALQGPEWRWTQAIAPSFVLERDSLRGFLDWYSREMQLSVDLTHLPESVHVEEILVHGDIRGLTPQEALDAVLPTCGLSYRQVGTVLVLEAPAPGRGSKGTRS